MGCGALVRPPVDLMIRRVKQGKVIHTDDTRVADAKPSTNVVRLLLLVGVGVASVVAPGADGGVVRVRRSRRHGPQGCRYVVMAENTLRSRRR